MSISYCFCKRTRYNHIEGKKYSTVPSSFSHRLLSSIPTTSCSFPSSSHPISLEETTMAVFFFLLLLLFLAWDARCRLPPRRPEGREEGKGREKALLLFAAAADRPTLYHPLSPPPLPLLGDWRGGGAHIHTHTHTYTQEKEKKSLTASPRTGRRRATNMRREPWLRGRTTGCTTFSTTTGTTSSYGSTRGRKEAGPCSSSSNNNIKDSNSSLALASDAWSAPTSPSAGASCAASASSSWRRSSS